MMFGYDYIKSSHILTLAVDQNLKVFVRYICKNLSALIFMMHVFILFLVLANCVTGDLLVAL